MALLSAICFEKWKLVGKRAAREDYYGLSAFWGENKGLTVAGKGIWVLPVTIGLQSRKKRCRMSAAICFRFSVPNSNKP